MINAGQQIAGAFTLASVDGYTVTNLSDLTDGLSTGGQVYLSQIPTYKGEPLNESYGFIVALVSEQVCQEIVDRAKGKGQTIPSLADANPINNTTDLYNCSRSDADDSVAYVAYYKVNNNYINEAE